MNVLHANGGQLSSESGRAGAKQYLEQRGPSQSWSVEILNVAFTCWKQLASVYISLQSQIIANQGSKVNKHYKLLCGIFLRKIIKDIKNILFSL